MNESDLTNVVNELERGHRAFKAFEYGLDAARAVQNLAQVERETQARIDALKRDEEAAQYALITAQDALKDTKAAAEKLVADAAKRKQDTEAAAREQATALVGAATEQAEAIQRTVDQRKVEAHELQRIVEDRRAELTDLEARIVKARAKAKAIIGGGIGSEEEYLPPEIRPVDPINAPVNVTDDEE